MNQAANPGLADAVARLTAPGAPFELETVQVDGRAVPAFRHAPAHLSALIEATRVHGDKPFITFRGETWSFARFHAQADALAAALVTEIGLRPGDRVALAMRNRPEWAIAFAAIVRAGGVPTLLNSFGLRRELREALEEVHPALLICDDERLQRLEGEPGCPVIVAGPSAAGVPTLDALVAKGLAPPPLPQPGPDDPALLLFTSGSTARAKAVLSSQRAVVQAVINIDWIGAVSALTSPAEIAALMARGRPPATLTVVPLFHVSGLFAQLLTTLRNGRRMVMMWRWDPLEAARLIAREGITQFSAAPAMVQQLFDVPGFDPTMLAGVGFGGAGLPQRLINDVLQRLPGSISGIGFGMTETNGVGAAISGRLFAQRPASAGLVTPIIQARIVGAGDGQLPPGEAGEIWLRGVTVMDGYWGQPEATAAALRDGWMRTGDIGFIDADGFLHVIDRIKDVINRSGEKIAAAEVESCLSQHPAVAEVAVIGRPDAVTGEAVVAVVVPRPGPEPTPQELIAHVVSHLASYKAPAQVVIRREPLPRSAIGKVLKTELRELHAKP